MESGCGAAADRGLERHSGIRSGKLQQERRVIWVPVPWPSRWPAGTVTDNLTHFCLYQAENGEAEDPKSTQE